MRTTYRAALTGLLALGLFTTALAAKNPNAPRALQPGLKINAVAPQGTIAPLGIGALGSLAMYDGWMTSDWEADEWTTNLLWYDQENLEVMLGFFSPKSKPITARVIVKDDHGVVHYDEAAVFEIDPGFINWVSALIGQLPEGNYKITGKIKQGDKIVGQTFWISTVLYVP